MLEWNHETRASAEAMLKHPWLTMTDNYEFKYTNHEYEVMMMKKDLKNQMKGGATANQDDAPEEM
jgi:hypothetical protein